MILIIIIHYSEAVINDVTEFIKKQENIVDFKGEWMFVAHWEQVSPFGYRSNTDTVSLNNYT